MKDTPITPAILALAQVLPDRHEVERRVLKSRSALYRAIQNEGFPAPVQIGKRRVAWREDEINTWIASRVAGVRTCSANTTAAE